MLERWFPEIINSFIVVNGIRMSNGPMESLNSRIRRIIDNGFGFSRFPRFRNKVMYSLNKDEPIKF
jgi:transposase